MDISSIFELLLFELKDFEIFVLLVWFSKGVGGRNKILTVKTH